MFLKCNIKKNFFWVIRKIVQKSCKKNIPSYRNVCGLKANICKSCKVSGHKTKYSRLKKQFVDIRNISSSGKSLWT